jgi:acetyl esterase/lipase
MKDIFGPDDKRPDTQPINHVTVGVPPLWLGTGSKDTVVLPRNSVNLARKVEALGGEAELHVYKGMGHPMTVGAIAAPLRGAAPILRDIVNFIDAHTGRTAP